MCVHLHYLSPLTVGLLGYVCWCLTLDPLEVIVSAPLLVIPLGAVCVHLNYLSPLSDQQALCLRKFMCRVLAAMII